jgi:hypothetical protein
MMVTKVRLQTPVIILLLLIGAAVQSPGREPGAIVKYDHPIRRAPAASANDPIRQYTTHNRGNMQLAIANNGTFGTFGDVVEDPFTGEGISSCVYPKGSDHLFLYVGAFWIGAVVGRDTLVSVGSEDFYQTDEFWPDQLPFGEFSYKSIDINSSYYSLDALSEEDIYCEYMDTTVKLALVGSDPTDGRQHRPLNIKVSQRSMAWSYDYADDFILFDYQIQNIGTQRLNNVYMGIWVDGDAWHISRGNPQEGWNDDIVGFLRDAPAPEGCGFIDTVNIAWHADNDGDPFNGAWDYRSPRAVVGTRVVRTPSDSLSYSFNWWIIDYSDVTRDFGPRRAEEPGRPFRSFGTRLGTPEGDANKYYIMRKPEFDYDLMYTAIDKRNQGWLPPPETAEQIAAGYDSRYLLSFGPFNVDPGQRLPISFAWVGGENFHREPADFEQYFNPFNPSTYYEHLDFSGLAVNARWASWVYDNPGRDTDNDGFRGKFRVCAFDSIIESIDTSGTPPDIVIDTAFRYTIADTFYYEGDGVPDFEGAGPPPEPKIRIIPSNGKLVVRWNGYYSETTRDVFLNQVDFEGYRVYFALDDRQGSFRLLRSYDRENYNRFRYKTESGTPGWVLEDIPFTIDSLRALYGDSTFNPDSYTKSRPLTIDGESYYFSPQDYNQSDLTDPLGIRKVYPDISLPPADTALWTDEFVTHDYGAPLPKYYEYEYVIDNIQPTVQYYVAVTAFDFGSPQSGLPALESNPVNNFIAEYAQVSSDTVETYGLDAYIYPNPYRADADYVGQGYEERDLGVDKHRLLHFANLPRVCRISVYSLDGDKIIEIEHNHPDGGPQAMHETWNMITRNRQAVQSGIYYWIVESAERTQIGKLVIIK